MVLPSPLFTHFQGEREEEREVKRGRR